MNQLLFVLDIIPGTLILKTFFMKHLSVITSVLSKVDLQNQDIEDVINHRLRKDKYRTRLNSFQQNSFSPDFETVQTLTTPMPVKGNLQICFSNERSGKIEKLEVPVYSSFLVTCLKGKDCIYKIGISVSLS